MKYLKPKQEYVDRYERITVNRCRMVENAFTASDIKKYSGEEYKEEQLERMSGSFNDLYLWYVMGELYRLKDSTISKWMEEDAKRDHFYEETCAPVGINCLTCGREMFVTSKSLETGIDNKPDRMLFIYDCPQNHLPRRIFFDDGEEWKALKTFCPKCRVPLKITDGDTAELWRTISTCPNCGKTKVHEIRRIAEVPPDLKYEEDRVRFCSESECMKYVDWLETAKEITDFLDKKKEKEDNNNLYDQVAKIKRLKIIELETLITPILESAGFIRLQFQTPQTGRNVFVPFIIYDSKNDRSEHDSVHTLKDLLKTCLEDTNWRLVTDNINHRLGMLEGRFKAYENEEDLIKLIKP